MPRSKEGLSAAGEWHQLKPLFPPLHGKSVLDLGCGTFRQAYRFCTPFGIPVRYPRYNAAPDSRPRSPMHFPDIRIGCDVAKQHHTLTQIVMGLLDAGFEIQALEEAVPPEDMMGIPGMEDELRPGPVPRLSVLRIDPVLPHPCREHRVLYIKEERSARLTGSVHLSEYLSDIRNMRKCPAAKKA